MTTLFVSLLIQGAGGLFLAVVCWTLYAYRRRPFFLYWTLAWLCFSGWLLLGDLRPGGAPPWRTAVWLQNLAAVLGWWHAALWMDGMVHFLRAQEPAARSEASPWAGYPSRLVLALTAAAAFAVNQALAWPARNVLLAAVLTLVCGLSAALFASVYWRRRRPGALLMAVFLSICAAIRLYDAAFHVWLLRSGTLPELRTYVTLADFFILTFMAVGMVVVLLDEEQEVLRGTLQRLAESEDRFRLTFEHGGVGMALLSPDGRFVQVNPALARFFGLGEEELRGRRLDELEAASERGRPPTSGERPAAYEGEKRFLYRDGSVIWARVLRVPVPDAAGAPRYHVGVLVDVTEQKRTEELLSASEQRYRLRFQGAPDGILVWSETGEVLDTNPAFCRMLGYSREELLALTAEQVAADRDEFRRRLDEALARRGVCFESRLLRKDGAALDVELSIAPVELDGRRLLHGIGRDVGARKRAEEALRGAEAQLREERDFSTQVLETADALLFVLDPEGRVVRFNGTCAAVSGYSEGEVRGRVFWEALLADRFVRPARDVFAGVAGGGAGACEHAWLTRAGKERLIALRHAAVRDGQGRLRYVIGSGMDVTDQRRLEEQVRRAQKMQTLGTLVGGIAHDFNNQLTAVLGNLELAADDCRLRVADHPHVNLRQVILNLQAAEQAARHCADMTQRLLAFSRRRMSPAQPLVVNAVIEEAARLLPRVLPPNVRVEFRPEPRVRPVSADSTQLHQVLMHLATNAGDAMPLGGTLTLTSANRALGPADCEGNIEARSGDFVEVAVADTGTGMTAEVQARLFEPFFTTKPVGRGSGLGLAMTFGIVKAHQGWIAVESVPGRGSTFRVFLPAAAKADKETGRQGDKETRRRGDKEDGSTGSPCPTVSLSGRGAGRVLVVDDEPLVRKLTCCVLERDGFGVLTAADGEEALAVYRDHAAEIDLVLLDYMMPKLNGLQVFQALQKMDRNVRVIFSSGYTMDSDSDQLLATGARAFVPKPYRPEQLLKVVREVLGQPVGG